MALREMEYRYLITYVYYFPKSGEQPLMPHFSCIEVTRPAPITSLDMLQGTLSYSTDEKWTKEMQEHRSIPRPLFFQLLERRRKR